MSDSARILITGDTHLGWGRVTNLAQQNRAEELFGDFLPIIRDADLSITNLESPVIDGGKPIEKTGPALKSPVDSLKVLKTAGFGLVTLANNHIMDYGEEGLYSTIEACRNNEIETTGAGKNLETAREPYFCEINGLKLAILNFAENEFGTTQENLPGGNPLDPVQNFYSIRDAKKIADHVIVIVHGGHEHYEYPSPRMKKTYRFFADAGAGAVIGHHTHCPAGFEVYNQTPICYSLGNFLFDKPNQNRSERVPWNEALTVVLTFSNEQVKADYQAYMQCGEEAGLQEMNEQEKKYFWEKLRNINAVIANDTKLQEKFDMYCESKQRLYSTYIEPHSVRVLHALRNREIIPSLLSKKKKKLLLNLTRCEAHKDVLIKTLSS